MARKVTTRKWEVFAGKNKFYCDGYLMTAPKTTVFYLTVFLITGTSGLFFAFDCPFLARKITPAIPIIGGVLYVFVMSSLFRTSFSDPGIIPRASADEAADIEKQIEVPNSLNSPTYRPPPRTKEVCVNGQTVKLKYCFTCKIFRPPRASHCSLCDNCVERFDHHCPWVGNCVGKRNYRFFYMFIVSLAFLAVFIFSCAMTHIILLTKENEPVIVVIRDTPSSVIVATICFFSVWSVIGLAGFHTYLTSSDQTTNEDIKGSFSTKNGQQAVNPYSHGNICRNCFHILCGPVAPSLIDRRGIVTEDDRIQMEYDAKYTSVQQPPMIVQPIGAPAPTGTTIVLDPFNRPYNTEINKSETGFYRQRSYDNLQPNDKSGSVAHLVENEIPLSTSTVAGKQTDDTKIILGNLTDSYNNMLHREPPPLPANAEIDVVHRTAPTRTENVYSNVLPTPIGQSRIQPVPGPLRPIRPAELQTWNDTPTTVVAATNNTTTTTTTTTHVYSNIEEKMQESIDIFLKTMPYRRRDSNNDDDDDDDEFEDVDDDNDGDQDDRMTMTVSDDEISPSHEVGVDDLVNNSATSGKLTLSTSSSSAATAATQIDMRSSEIRPGTLLNVKLGRDGCLKNGTVSGVIGSSNSNNNNNSIGSSNSIGNASDLDGSSSIDNNSQSCLVKPAIV